MAESIEFDLKVGKDNLNSSLENAEKKAKSLGTAINVAIGSFAATAAVKGLSLIADGFREVSAFIEESVKASAESESSLKQLQVALAGTNKLTKENIESFQELANQIQATTTFEDDAVISNIALIQSLARLDKEGLERATIAATNLAATFNIDLETASRLIGKSAEGNTAAFGKLGIQFEKGTTNAETFANVLNTLESRFGGAAEAQAKTFTGALTQLSNVYGDLKENIGNIVTQSPAVIAAFGVLRGIVLELGKSINTAFGNGDNDLIANFFRLILDSSNAVVLSVDAIIRVFDIAASSVMASIRIMALGIVTPIAGILELIAAIPGIGDSFKGAADSATAEMNRLSKAFDENISSINNSLNGETALSKFSLGIAEARTNFDVLYEDIKSKAPDLKNNLAVSPIIEDPQAAERVLALKNQLLEIESNFLLAKDQLNLENQLAEQDRFTVRTEEQLAQLNEFELQKSDLIYQAALRNNKLLKSAGEIEIADKKALKEKELRDLNASYKLKASLRAQDIANQDAFLNAAATLQSSSNKTLATIGKSAALVQIGINTQKSASSSFAFGSSIGGPALGAAFAAIAVAAGTAQAAKVAGIQGFADGGIVGNGSGASMGPDNTIIKARDGEAVLTANDQKLMFDMLRRGGGGGDIIVQIDGRTVAVAVRDQIKAGFKLGATA